jgi:mannose-6-phosphate isomerase-like protein (cupin superfamily)
MANDLVNHTQSYLTRLAQYLRCCAAHEAELSEFATLLEEVDTTTAKICAGAPLDHPTKQHLKPLLDLCGAAASLNASVRALADDVSWCQVYQGTGFFLLAPGLHYPLHTHAAQEIYFVISGDIKIQHGIEGSPFDICAGHQSYTPSNQLHSLKTGDAPVLVLYIWMGEVDSPNLIWEQDDSGCWQNPAGHGSLMPVGRKPMLRRLPKQNLRRQNDRGPAILFDPMSKNLQQELRAQNLPVNLEKPGL